MLINQALTDRMQSLKDLSGLTYDQIGEITGTSSANARRYITGECKSPDIQLLCHIIRAMGGDPREVIFPPPDDPSEDHAPTETQLYDRIFTNMEARFVRQEQRHRADIELWQHQYADQIQSLIQSTEAALATKDDWISRLRQERDEAASGLQDLQAKFDAGQKNRNRLLFLLFVVGIGFSLLFFAYVIPDIMDHTSGFFLH